MSWIKFCDLNKKKYIHNTAIENYNHNKAIGISAKDCITVISGKTLLRAQSLGSFPKMKLSCAKLSKTCCGVIATYNALKLYGLFPNDKDFNGFFKLCSEFVVNALLLLPTGHFGSNPFMIKNCLATYNIPYSVYKNPVEFENTLNEGDISIVSFRHHFVCMHTFCLVKQNGSLVSINRGNGCNYEWKDNTLSDCLRKHKFLVGYILKK